MSSKARRRSFALEVFAGMLQKDGIDVKQFGTGRKYVHNWMRSDRSV